MKYLNVSSSSVYQVYFRADDFPAIEVALQLTPLKTGDGYEATNQIDYGIRWGVADMMRLAFTPDRKLAIQTAGYDSVVQLYKNRPREAEWIPMCERIFRGE